MTAQGSQDAAPGLSAVTGSSGQCPPAHGLPSRASACGPSAGSPTALFLSPPDVSHVFPEFPAPDLGSTLLQESILPQDVRALQLAYRRHCEVTAPRATRGEPAPGCGASVGRSAPQSLVQSHACPSGPSPEPPNAQTSPGVPEGRKGSGVAPGPSSQAVDRIPAPWTAPLRPSPSPLWPLGVRRHPTCSPCHGCSLGIS